jgi:16S rRNA (uracil1498-N3)-methyltransferase
MNLFFTSEIENEIACFKEDEARHVIQVLRKRAGDTIEFVDGQGHWFEAEITEVNRSMFFAKVLSERNIEKPDRKKIKIAIAPTKNIDRFEWFLEKATEIGIDEITPLICANSERTTLRTERLEKVLIAAMKQSLKASLPRLNKSIHFGDFIRTLDFIADDIFVAHCRSHALPHLKHNYSPGKDVCILIGPEGDFSRDEVDDAERAGCLSVSLGNTRLRTETAGIVACHLINLLND